MHAALWAPSMAERPSPRGSCGAPRPRRDGVHTLAGAGSHRAPALANAAVSAALRNGTDGATAAVVSSERKIARVPRNKLHTTSTTSPRHSTHPTILMFDLSKVQFPSKPGDPLQQQCNMAAWASLLHFRVHAACRTGTKFRTELQREDEQKWEWVIPKKEAGYSTSAQSAGSRDTRPDKEKWERAGPKTEAARNTGSNDSYPVLPRDSVLQHS